MAALSQLHEQVERSSGVVGEPEATWDHWPENHYITRQPVFDRRQRVWAYDILTADAESLASGGDATAAFILDFLSEAGLSRVVGDRLAMVEIPPGVVQDRVPLLPVEATVLRFRSEDLDDPLLERMERLADEGYLIGLASRPPEGRLNRALGVADCVSIDVSFQSREESTAQAEELSSYGIRLIATGVDDRWTYEFARDIGCHYFQGYFFCRPDLDGRNPTRHNQARLLTLLKRLQDPDLDFSDVEEIIKQDVALSYRLLRCLNSAAFAMATRVTSVGHALVLLGMDNLRKWLTVFALSGVEGKPPELIRTALQRAKMAEILGKILRHPSPELLFTVGLFSVLDGLLDRRMEEAVAGLPLAPEVVRALVDRDGFEGSVLKVVEAYEAGRWDDVVFPGLGANIVSSAWLDTIRWTASLPL